MLWIQWFRLWPAVLRVFLAMAVVAATPTTSLAVPARQIDPTAQRLLTVYGRPGEQIVAIEPPLVEGNVVYRVYYFTRDSYTAADSSFFFRASTTFFTENAITGKPRKAQCL